MDDHETVVVDGSPVRVHGHLNPEDMEPFGDVVRAAKEYARKTPAPPCRSPRCDYEEPHDHGFACGPKCLCGKGMQAASATPATDPEPTETKGEQR